MSALFVAALAAYLAFWPIAVRPVAWQSPQNPGYTGDFTANNRLADLDLIDLDGRSGPEDAAAGPDGLIYAAMHDGEIIRIQQDGRVSSFAQTHGRPLGIEFGPDGTLYAADAFRGLLAINRSGAITLLTERANDGSAILYANDLDIAADGTVYFSDASTRFSAAASGSTLSASILDLAEHSDSARVLKFDPATGQTSVFADGLTFANGVALSSDGSALFVIETGAYRLWRFPIDGGPGVVVLDNLPGFPDNINRAGDGTFWLGLVSPRNAIMDRFSDAPFVRHMVMRLPSFLRPAPTRYGFVLRVDEDGRVIETLQDPSGAYALTTGAITLPDGRLAVTSLIEPHLGIVRAPFN